MRRKGGARHLVYFIDGTWLWAGSDDSLDVYSNIYRLNTLLEADSEDGRAQIVHYSRGLGAVRGLFKQYTAGGFASGIDELIADLYVNICSNYQRGDKIYIFGFSRGAVVARALTGLLSYGILEAHRINMFAHVWAAYTGQGSEVLLPGQARASLDRSIGRTLDYTAHCSERNPRIEFVGVFDTVVGGNGIAEVAQRLRLAARSVQPNVKHAVQLLAVDESRTFFKPILWTGIGNPKQLKLNWRPTTLEQIWMPGVHSDVGGAYSKRQLGNLALLTMIDRVIARTPLRFNLSNCRKLQVISDDPIRIHNEFTRTWNMLSGEQARQIDPGVSSQLIHPFAKRLMQVQVNYKLKKKLEPYSLTETFLSLPEAKEFRSGKFKSNCDALPVFQR